MSYAKACAVSLLSLVFAGCAFTRTETKVDFAPQITSPLTASAPDAGLTVGHMKDTRSVKDERVIMHKKNGYGQTTTGAYVADRPISEILQGGVVSALRENRFPLNDTGAKYNSAATSRTSISR